MIRSFFKLRFSFHSPATVQALSIAGGLVIGLVFTLIASAFMGGQGSEQGFLPAPANRIFRVGIWIEKPGAEHLPFRKTAGQLAPLLVAQMPEMEATARIMTWPERVAVTNFNRNLSTNRWCFADPAIAEIFGLSFMRGDAANALARPGQVVLTESVSKKLFGTVESLGRTLMGLGGKIYTVSGVVRTPLQRAPLQFDVLASWCSTLENSGLHHFRFMNNWTANTVETYVRLRRAEDAPLAGNRISGALRDKIPGQAGQYSFFLEPIAEPAPKIGTTGTGGTEKFSGNLYTARPGMVLLHAPGMLL